MSTWQTQASFDIQQLLGRPVKAIDEGMVRSAISGRRVLVSGAGGSIGSELCKQVVRFGARELVMLESCEFNLYQVDGRLREASGKSRNATELHSILHSATDRSGVRRIFKNYRPEIVLHAAAFKHVPLVEANPLAGIRNNINSTMILAEAALDFETSKFLLVSSDKAVNPTNVMGLTKRCCELIVQAMATTHPGRVKFMSVRFGNVLGSSGSVLPRFLEQIQKGGPLTVTHPEVTRYFMMIEEAVGLVLQSAAMARGGEIFVLNMGQPVRIVELAEQVIRATGREPYRDIGIEFTGLRAGEKLYEELILEGSETATTHGDIFVAVPDALEPAKVLSSIRQLMDLAEGHGARECVHAIREIVFGKELTQAATIELRASRNHHTAPPTRQAV